MYKQPMIIRPKGLRLLKISYLAGIIDGEGTINIYKGKRSRSEYNLRFYVVNTDKRMIEWLKANFGGLVYSRKSKEHPDWRKKWEWVLDKKQVDLILKDIIPFLQIKKEQANLALKFRKTIGNRTRISNSILRKREQYYQDMKQLNNREWE